MEYIQLTEYNELPDIVGYAPFKTVIAIEDSVSAERQQDICNWLVKMGCKYVMICGEDCRRWEEMIRQINLEQVSLDDMKPEDFIMITTHAGERLRAVYWHAKKHARHTHVKMQGIVTVHIGNKSRSADYLGIFQKA